MVESESATGMALEKNQGGEEEWVIDNHHGRSPEGVRKLSDRLKRTVFFQKLALKKRQGNPGH